MKWERSNISPEERAERYNQRSMLILITGEKQTGKKRIAKQLETRLFNDGKFVYYLGIGSVVYGVDADIRGQKDFEGHHEHIRRLAEIAHMMLDSGVILIVTAVELTQADLEIIRTAVGIEKIQTIWVGERVTTDINFDLQMQELVGTEQEALQIKHFLQDLGVIFSP
jgi:bifunctional enzyme CysN/CysC